MGNYKEFGRKDIIWLIQIAVIYISEKLKLVQREVCCRYCNCVFLT